MTIRPSLSDSTPIVRSYSLGAGRANSALATPRTVCLDREELSGPGRRNPTDAETIHSATSTRNGGGLRLVPVAWADACRFIRMWHRHLRPPQGHKFCVGVADTRDRLVGVAVVGRPVSRMVQDGLTLEVTRVATDGTRNACSMLYAAAWRAAKALGYRRLISYTQGGESGASLRAAGWTVVAKRRPHSGWSRLSRPRRDHGVDNVPRTVWEAP